MTERIRLSETKPMPTENRHGTNRRIEQRNKTGAPIDLAGALYKTHKVSTILVECVPQGWNNEEHKNRAKAKTGRQRLQRTFQWMFSNGNGCSLLRSVSTESVHYFIIPVARTLSVKQISPDRFGAILIIGLALVPEHVALYGTRHRGGGNTIPHLC